MNLEQNKFTVLVSGAGGFLGHELVKQLIEDGTYNVIALSSKKQLLIDEFKGSPNLKVLHIDNWKTEIEQDIFIDFLVNCAFPRSSKPEELAKGLVFTENLINDAIDLNIGRIINISSQSVYSQKAKSPADEMTLVSPESIYGMAKYASERIVSVLHEANKHKVCTSNIRLASLSGTGLEVRMTNRFVKNALTGQPLTINGGSQYISYLDVRDAASAIIAMLNADIDSWDTVYNLGNDDYCTVLELAKIVEKVAKEYSISDVKIEVHEGQNDFNNLINSEKFYNEFNWRSHYTMIKMVEELFNYYNLQM